MAGFSTLQPRKPEVGIYRLQWRQYKGTCNPVPFSGEMGQSSEPESGGCLVEEGMTLNLDDCLGVS